MTSATVDAREARLPIQARLPTLATPTLAHPVGSPTASPGGQVGYSSQPVPESPNDRAASPPKSSSAIASRTSTMELDATVRSRALTTGDLRLRPRPSKLRTLSSFGGTIAKKDMLTPKTPYSARSSRPDSVATVDSQWSIDEAFGDALRQAEDEGVDLFAPAPTPTFRQSAQEDRKPTLRSPCVPSSGLVLQDKDVHRLDQSLTRDYFERPSWNASTLPKKRPEDLRTLETIAREKRASKMRSYLRREEKNRPKTCIGVLQDRGIANRKSNGTSPKMANQRPGTCTNRESIPGIPFDLQDDTIRTSRMQQDGPHNLLLQSLRV